MSNHTVPVIAASLLLWLAGPAGGQADPSARPDALHGAIDPYQPNNQRQRFLDAAGMDNELSAEEFAADAKSDEPFVKSFETWAGAMAFDRNGNGRLGWIEAEAWRLALRKRLLQAHDADDNGRLEGAERVKALAALGAAAPADRTPNDLPPGTSRTRGAWIRPYDTDGDGTLSQAEADAAAARLKDVWRRQMLERFDTDGDGQLSDAERKARRAYWRNRDRGQRKQWMLRYFDDDGDGEISQAERESFKKLGQSWKQFGQEIRRLALDTDGDGKVGKIEQAAVVAAWMAEGSRFMLKTQHWSDADGDGQVSWAEREAFQGRVRDAMVDWFDKFAAGYDRDGDGRFTQAQRREVVKGLQTELRNRIARVDVNNDGVISPTEGFDWIEAFGREIGAIPAEAKTRPGQERPGQIE